MWLEVGAYNSKSIGFQIHKTPHTSLFNVFYTACCHGCRACSQAADSDQQPQNRAPPSLYTLLCSRWCVREVLRTLKTSVVGWQKWSNRWLVCGKVVQAGFFPLRMGAFYTEISRMAPEFRVPVNSSLPCFRIARFLGFLTCSPYTSTASISSTHLVPRV